MKAYKYIIGVDEAGRGPLAGPVAIGVAVVPRVFNWGLIPKVGDSKKVSEKNREAIFLLTRKLQKEGKLSYVVVLVSATQIDKIGISKAVKLGIEKGLKKLNLAPKEVLVKLDGLLHAPAEYLHQETIIKGDAKEKVIGLASIMAKVTRDKQMVSLAKQYPEYQLEIHKGYGTKIHSEAIRKHGLSKIHRKTFCARLI